MEGRNSPDHLSSSLTDLMTSLMVIFVLLLLVFIQRSGAKDPAAAARLFVELERHLNPSAPNNPMIKQDQNRILLIAPERLMSFEAGKYALSERGKQFLAEKLPPIAATLYDKRFRDSIESIVVEGHSDLQVFYGLPPEESRNRNLELSQQRAMEVVKTALANLRDTSPEEQEWFISKLSASGRGQQDCSVNDIPEECRKVIFVIRIRAAEFEGLQERIQ
jgi:flagellar motor protein MotB